VTLKLSQGRQKWRCLIGSPASSSNIWQRPYLAHFHISTTLQCTCHCDCLWPREEETFRYGS